MTAPDDALAGAREIWALLRALANFRAPASPSNPVVSVGGAPEPRATLGEQPEAALISRGVGQVVARVELQSDARQLFERYAPLCHPICPSVADCGASAREAGRQGNFVVAHLGQSLDGRIAPPDGQPEAITGPEDVAHNHRMRALFDVVLVGAATVCHDDPVLTVRHVEGRNPVRVVIDPDRRLSSEYRVFTDGLAPTLLLCREERCSPGERHGHAEVLGVGAGCSPSAILQVLRERQLPRVFIEGGGVTVSRFLAARCLDRLQIAVSPFIMGQGRPGIDLAETLRLRPTVRRYELADDVLFECCFDDA
jgi:diaminohydroxyphosphoribosylaminopyrimidine deaminase / 5-amino-6-(5-phosphoribosylamino)uracil reductase